jgi:hypothetical protein
MDEREVRLLMQHTQQQMRRLGMEELLGQIAADAGQLDEPPASAMMRMLDLLDAAIRPHAAQTSERILGGFRDLARTRDGAAPARLSLEAGSAHRDLFDVEVIELAGARSLDGVVRALEELRAELRPELEAL